MAAIKREWFTGKIAFLIYIFIAIIAIMFIKYQLDIMKDERHYEIKKEYDDDRSAFHPARPLRY